MAFTAANATASTTTILAHNPHRKYLLIINDSDVDVYLMFGAAAVLNTGIRLNGGGSSYLSSVITNNLDTRDLRVIHGGAGNQNILMIEYP